MTSMSARASRCYSSARGHRKIRTTRHSLLDTRPCMKSEEARDLGTSRRYSSDWTRRDLPRSAALAVAYFALGVAALALFPLSGGIAVFWPASGIALAALIAWGPRIAVGLALGCVAVGLYAGLNLRDAGLWAVTTTVSLAFAWWLLARVARFDPALRRRRDVIAFLVCGAVPAPVASVAARLVMLATNGSALGEQATAVWVAGLGEAVGILVVAPVIWTWIAARREAIATARRLELVLLTAAVVGVAAFVFMSRSTPVMAVEPLTYAVFPVLFWAALRFGSREAAMALLVAATIAVWCTAHGLGPFGGGDMLRNLGSLYVFLAVAAVSTLLIAVVLRERERAERALRESEEQFRLIVEHQTELVLKLSPSRHVLFASPSYLAYFGVSENELVGRAFVADVHEEDRTAMQALWEAVLAPPHMASAETRVMTRDGWRWLAWSASAIRDAHGNVDAIVAVARDVTARRRAEEQARQHLEQLAHVARVSSMGEMASAIAHEINQPLTAIANYSYACLRLLRSKAASSDEIQQAMQRVASEAERAGEIVRHMRNFVRSEGGRTVEVEVNFLVTEVVRLAAAEARQSGIELATRLDTGLPAVLADSIQIQQVLLNLVRNAVEAMNLAGAEERRIELATRPGNRDFVEITVADTGPGLASTELEKVFEPFYTTKPDGIGIGLALSRSIIDAHGGRLWATANAGPGVTFHLTLPLAHELDPS
jgi:two-component system sensor kinase FixL